MTKRLFVAVSLFLALSQAHAQTAPAPAPDSSSAQLPAVPVNYQYLLKYNLSSVDPQAVCQDGSPGVYYFQQGSGSGLNKCG